ncbi:hypothetical protein CHLRE_17g726450v5 [Chlamydomonas reinhardtii]|uniref:Uncharacterized protein ycf33 n=1 Tax=Chlamydomonas reinhardtii TaxID=3055 RepID=A0A2K3CQQ7_CHLRE|nr:uncharacterized protein CHLRE_17g726450v5 [Chlamydomonas reinhardtii]PNW70595.1 hypothetical protein CHLRE_17g726450v5 [Chlamydomonas reinhardtii]
MLRSSRAFTGCPRLARRAQATRVRVASQQRPCSAECSTSGSSDNLWWRTLASIDAQKAQPVAAVALLMLGMAAGADPASATDLAMADAHSHAQPIAELAEQDLLSNLARYGRYFVTVMLGTGYVMLRPLQAMFKKPLTAVFGLVALGALLYGTRVALELMLGLDNSFSYDGDNFRIVTDYTQ